MSLVHLEGTGDGISQKELALLAGIDGSNLVRVLDILARDGLIERRRDEADGRARLIHLTAPKPDPVSFPLCQTMAVFAMSAAGWLGIPLAAKLVLLALACGIFYFVAAAGRFGPPGPLIFIFRAGAAPLGILTAGTVSGQSHFRPMPTVIDPSMLVTGRETARQFFPLERGRACSGVGHISSRIH